ncbi:hypothetical protein [Octadecabacter sp. R77987]|uniref:hypothetical protein n=1 Tax=Octadecabacter sp. R77987 TaxID=3093874 RepID=UPI00367080EA
MIRLFVLLTSFAMLAACARDDLSLPPEPLGAFRMGFNIVVAPNPEMGPLSREATPEEWIASVETAINDRFSRFEGNQFYHIAVSVDGYVLAQPGVPLIYTPKSVLIIGVTFYEDATQTKLNEEPIQLTIFEACCNVPLIGSGLSKTREEQLEALSFNAARAIERTMRENGEWFGGTDEVLEADATIVTGNVLVDDPDAILPPETPDGDAPLSN